MRGALALGPKVSPSQISLSVCRSARTQIAFGPKWVANGTQVSDDLIVSAARIMISSLRVPVEHWEVLQLGAARGAFARVVALGVAIGAEVAQRRIRELVADALPRRLPACAHRARERRPAAQEHEPRIRQSPGSDHESSGGGAR